MNTRYTLLGLVVLIFLLCASAFAIDRRGYYPEDWISYTNTRYVRSIAVGFYNVYFGTTQGILQYDMNREQWLDPITSSDGLPDDEINMITVTDDGNRIHVNTPSGNYMYETAFKEWYPSDLFPISEVRNDLNQIGTFETYIAPFGFHIQQPHVITGPELREYPISTAVKSSQGDIWLGTWGLGPGLIESYGVEIDLLKFGLYTSDCRTMYLNDDRFYFGGRTNFRGENALTIWNRADNSWKYIEARYDNSFISDQVNAITSVDDNIFMATDFGLVSMSPDGTVRKSYGSPGYFQTDLLLSLEHHGKYLFMGSDKGMYYLDLEGDSVEYMGGQLMANAAVLDIEYYKNDLWLGTDVGAVRYDFKTSRFYRYGSTGGVLLGFMIDIEADPSEGLWFAGEHHLVWMDDSFNERERFSIDADLDGFSPNKLAVGERFLWVATDYGMYRYDRLKHYWKHYLEDDGIIDNRVYDLLLDGDYLWIATAGGVTRFYWNNPMRSKDY